MNDAIKWLAGLAAVLLAMAFSAHIAPAASPGEPVFGDWLTQTGDAKVRIGPCAANASEACGVVIWLKTPLGGDGKPQHDANNPDQALRSRPILGLPMIYGFRRAADGQWTDGKIYDPNEGKTYKAKMVAAPGGVLKVSGCVLMFCQAQTWTKINPASPPG